MINTMNLPAAVPALLRSPGDHGPLTLRGEVLIDSRGSSVGRRVGPVWSFMDKPDDFYEGKFNNRVKHVPQGEGWLATLPLRIVLQNYPTTVAAEVPIGAAVVEIGCAGGITWFGRRYRMIGMDLSLEALQLAAADYELTLQCDATLMPLADESVDAVISSCLFEHLTTEQKTALLSEVFRVLKPGGKVVFLYDLWTENAIIAGYRRADPIRYQREFLDQDGHLGYASVEENRDFFRFSGLKITRELFHERTPFQSHSVWKKLSAWPGLRGRVAWMGAALTSGPLRLPMQALLSATDATLGRLFPESHARGMITVAAKL